MLRKPEPGYPGLIVSLAVLIVALLAMTDNPSYRPVSSEVMERSWANAAQRPYQFTDPAVLRRTEIRRQDTEQWHARSCKTDPRSYDCVESGKLLVQPDFSIKVQVRGRHVTRG